MKQSIPLLFLAAYTSAQGFAKRDYETVPMGLGARDEASAQSGNDLHNIPKQNNLQPDHHLNKREVITETNEVVVATVTVDDCDLESSSVPTSSPNGNIAVTVTAGQSSNEPQAPSSSAAETSQSKVETSPGPQTSSYKPITSGAASGTVSLPDLAKPSATGSSSDSGADASANNNNKYYVDGSIFKPISTDDAPSLFERKDLPKDLPQGVNNNNGPIHTNKFYANLFLDTQQLQSYTQPYSLWWSQLEGFPGMAVSHTTFDQRVSFSFSWIPQIEQNEKC